MTKEITAMLARGLWKYFEMELPDTPMRVAKATMHILTEAGYTIISTTNEETTP